MKLLETVTVSSPVAQVDLTAFDSALYTHYLVLARWQPVNDDDALHARLSNDGGSTFKSGATDYRAMVYTHGNAAEGAGRTIDDLDSDHIRVAWSTGNAKYGQTKVVCNFFHNTSFRSCLLTRSYTVNSTDEDLMGGGGGIVDATENNDALRLYCNTGNINAGKFWLYGV